MRDKQRSPSFSDMLSWLRDDFRTDGYEVHEVYEKEPLLPIDLFCTREKGSTKEYCFVIVASINEISDEFQKKLLFYQYYLSRNLKPSRYRIVLAIPASAEVETTPFNADEEEEKKQDFYKDNGFGLWKIKGRNSIDKKTYSPISLRDKMARDFNHDIAQKHPELRKRTNSICSFADRYIHDSVYATAGVYPVKFQERHIDAKILHKMLELKNVSYGEQLSSAISKHLSCGGGEYEFVRDLFSELWATQIGIAYNDFLKTFDPALQHIFAETKDNGIVYRDHYIHQFQVFLLGLYVMDKLYDDVVEKSKCKKPEISWLMISSFHDIGYPIQLYDQWSRKFFQEVFDVTEDIARIEIKSKFVEQSFMNATNCLIARLCSVFCNEELKGDWLADKKELLRFFYRSITEAKNHCILSGVSLLRMLCKEEYRDKITIDKMTFEQIWGDIIIPSALTIALHDSGVWGELRNKETWQQAHEKVPLPVLRFDDDPLSFLLIFCDNIQEWGRPSKSQSDEKNRKGKTFYLRDLQYDPQKGFNVTIWTPNYAKTAKFFKDKKTELGEIETFLQQPSDVKFAIRLEDENNKGEDFEMQGSPS